MNRIFLAVVFLPLMSMAAPASDETDAVAVVNKLFQGMAAHDGDMIRSTVLPDVLLYAAREGGDAAPLPKGLPIEDFVKRITALKSDLVERFTSPPQVSIRGRMAQVWGEYEFLRDGKFGHCGVDSVGLFKTADGWKIATLTYTMETTGCKR